jgi:hypothetical protein
MGRREVVFSFAHHVFGAGQYTVDVTLGDGWNFPDNYPYRRVFTRQIGAAQFTITPEVDGLDFGVVNARVPVHVTTEMTGDVAVVEG